MSLADTIKTSEARGVRRVATGVLVALTSIYLGTFLVENPSYWVLLIRATAEAGMIGGLADWFAVAALFRHPLGVPIPHTALLPRNQKRAAGNIARFIDEYFLAPEQVMAQLQKVNPVRLLANWLADRRNSKLVAKQVTYFVQMALKHQLERGIGAGAEKMVRDLLKNAANPAALSTQVSALLKDAVQSHLMDDILLEVRNVLDTNRTKVTEVVQDRSRWWIASSVDRGIVRVLVDGILSIIDELSDRDSDLRRDFDTLVVTLVESFQNSGRITQFLEAEGEVLIDSQEFAETVEEIITAVLSNLQSGLERDPDQANKLIAAAISEFSETVLRRPDLEDQLNARLSAGMSRLLEAIRPSVTDYIKRVIEEWDSEELVQRIENEVGRDLQFIRINGAVLGSMIGCFLHIATSSIH